MKRTQIRKIALALGALVCALVGLPQSVLGIAIYEAEIDVLVTAGPLPAGTGTAVIPSPTAVGVNFVGNAFAAGGAAAIPVAGNALHTSAFATGNAAFPPASFATSFGVAEGIIEVLNTNDFAVVVPITIDWSWDVLASTTLPGEAAFAAINFAVFLDGVLLLNDFAAVSSFGGLGLISAAAAGVDIFAPLLAPGLHIIDIDPTASGAAVPEPGTFLLLGTGFAALLGYGWRRRKYAVES